MTSEDWMMMSTMSYISDYDLALFPCKPLPNFLSECWARVWKQPMQTSAQLPVRMLGKGLETRLTTVVGNFLFTLMTIIGDPPLNTR